MKQSDDNKFIPMTSLTGGKETEVKEDIAFYTDQIVNVVFIGKPGDDNWILLDTGMPKSGDDIKEAAEKRFGRNKKPSAILLTHGHFDHVGGIVDLINEWKVPVYAHPLEFPYLVGSKEYPEPDPTVEGGLLAKLSSVYPHEPIDISEVLEKLPDDHSVPFLSDWIWIHTPGHSPGHVSYFRKEDKALVAGDAFITVRQSSFYKVLLQKKEINGPPRYLTTDWQAAWTSVKKLAALDPEIAVCGHGPHLKGEELKQDLDKLAREFDHIAIPDHGKYVDDGNDEG